METTILKLNSEDGLSKCVISYDSNSDQVIVKIEKYITENYVDITTFKSSYLQSKELISQARDEIEKIR